MEVKGCKNSIRIRGVIKDNPVFDHESYGEKFYRIIVLVERLSGTVDEVPVIVSERTINIDELKEDKIVNITGSIRSYNQHNGVKSKLLVFVLSYDIEIVSEYDICSDVNSAEITGYICRMNQIRETPLTNHEITDFILVTNRNYGKSDYIPCLAWGRNAKYCNDQLSVGSKISINGRFQSREYVKRYPDGTAETKIAYEVSIMTMEEVKEGEENEDQEL